jgi:hypothetical protein
LSAHDYILKRKQMVNDWADKITRPATSHALDGHDVEPQHQRQQQASLQRHDRPDHAFAPGTLSL